jgi:hypothetical protein
MPSLRDAFRIETGPCVVAVYENTLQASKGEWEDEIPLRWRAHLNFEAHCMYLSYFLPETPFAFPIIKGLIQNVIPRNIEQARRIELELTMVGGQETASSELPFSGRINFYSETQLDESMTEELVEEGKKMGYAPMFRFPEYANVISENKDILAFISHDSRNKEKIAEPLASRLVKLDCPVWYDEYSLQPGDSLRESIENGLKECSHCILVLTPEFLNNEGWGKREFDSIFTREIVEESNIIIPIWSNVSREQVYEYSPALADRVGIQWEEGVHSVAKEIKDVINPQSAHLNSPPQLFRKASIDTQGEPGGPHVSFGPSQDVQNKFNNKNDE